MDVKNPSRWYEQDFFLSFFCRKAIDCHVKDDIK